MFWLFSGVIVILLLYICFIQKCNYWSERNVCQNDGLTNLKTVGKYLLRTISFAEFIQQHYNDFANKRYSGFYLFVKPTLLIRDPELLKQIAIRDFDYFMDHEIIVPDNIDPYWSRTLLSLKGEKWRKMRATLTPSFTNSKMKLMFILISECTENFIKHLQNKNEAVIKVELSDLFTRYANDVIATCAFGISCDSLENRKNEFYRMGQKVSNISSFWKTLKLFTANVSLKLAILLRIKMFDDDLASFFHNLIRDTTKLRQEKKIVRQDMIHLLMESRNATKQDDVSIAEQPQTVLTDIDITAQALIFFFAGFDTVSRSLCFTTYELAVNKEIQDKLRKEVDETSESCNGKLTYEAIMKMKYLDMVISETMRKWPNIVMTNRLCVKDYTIQPINSDEKPLSLTEGDIIWFPIFGLHRDEKYFPRPERFDPERFNDENKSKINPYAYIPLGAGPRNCIGSKFALLEIKCVLCHIISNFEIVPIAETQIPLKIAKQEFNLTAENGFRVGLKSRK